MSGGGALGLGKSKSVQQSESYQEGFSEGTSYGTSGSVSGDNSSSISGSYGEGSSSSRTTQEVAFEDLFSQLYGNATGAAGRSAAMAPELAAITQQLFSGGMQFMEGLGGDAGSEYLEGRITGDNPLLEEQIGMLEEDTTRLFTERLNPAITSRAVAGGTLGGGRQGVAQGLGMETAMREFARGSTALRSDDMARRDSAALAVASNSLGAASTGLGALPGLLELATEGTMSELNAYGRLSSILGGPTVLSDSTSSASDFSSSSAQSIAQAFARSFGEQGSVNRSSTKGTSSGSGKASGWNFNMSGYGGVGASGGG